MTTPTATVCTSSRSIRWPNSKGWPTAAFGYIGTTKLGGGPATASARFALELMDSLDLPHS
jgi:hypothetical protein